MKMWQNIPLDVFENHINDSKIALSKTLNNILKNQLKDYGPDSLAIWGIAGGSGLEQAKDYSANEIIGIDINQKYLDVCSQRYKKEFTRLKLHQMNLDNSGNKVFKVDFIWAPLIFNYLNNHKLNLKYASESLESNGVLSLAVLTDVSSNNINLPEAEKINLDEFEALAENVDLHLIESSIVTTVSGIELQLLDFIKNKDSE